MWDSDPAFEQHRLVVLIWKRLGGSRSVIRGEWSLYTILLNPFFVLFLNIHW